MNKKLIYVYLLFAVLNPIGVGIFRLTGWLCGSNPIIIITVFSSLSIISSVLCLKKENKMIFRIFYYLIPVCSIILFPILVSVMAGYAKFESSVINKTWPFVWMNVFWVSQILVSYFTFTHLRKKRI